MPKPIHQCQCSRCQQPGPHPDKFHHQRINLFVSRLNEQARRWYVAIESLNRGRGGIRELAQITGMDEKTIWRGRGELATQLEGRPTERVRLPGGGRPRLEKKRHSSSHS